MLASNGFDGRSHQCCIKQIDGLAHECVLFYGRHGLRLPRLLTLLGGSSGRVAGNRVDVDTQADGAPIIRIQRLL